MNQKWLVVVIFLFAVDSQWQNILVVQTMELRGGGVTEVINPKGDVIVYVKMNRTFCNNSYYHVLMDNYGIPVECNVGPGHIWKWGYECGLTMKEVQLQLAKMIKILLKNWISWQEIEVDPLQGHSELYWQNGSTMIKIPSFPKGARLAFITSLKDLVESITKKKERTNYVEVMDYHPPRLDYEYLESKYNEFCRGPLQPEEEQSSELLEDIQNIPKGFRDRILEGNTIFGLLPDTSNFQPSSRNSDGSFDSYTGPFEDLVKVLMRNESDIPVVRVLLALVNRRHIHFEPTRDTKDSTAKQESVNKTLEAIYQFLELTSGKFPRQTYTKYDLFQNFTLYQFPAAVKDALFHKVAYKNCIYSLKSQVTGKSYEQMIDDKTPCVIVGGECMAPADMEVMEEGDYPYGLECPDPSQQVLWTPCDNPIGRQKFCEPEYLDEADNEKEPHFDPNVTPAVPTTTVEGWADSHFFKEGEK